MMPLMSEQGKFEMMPIFFFFTSGQILRVSYKIETESEVGPNMRQDLANQSMPAFRICLEFNEKTREYSYL